MAKGPSNTQRIAMLEEQVAELNAAIKALENRPATVAAGITAGELGGRVNEEIGPINNKIWALEAILRAYEKLLIEHGVSAEEISNAVKESGQQLTQRQWDIVRDLLQSV